MSKKKEEKKETASQLMTSNIPTIHGHAKVADVEELLLKNTKKFETINYIYVVDDKGKLTGVISIKEIFRSPKSKLIKELLPKEVISARSHTDTERVAFLALKHNIKSVPVVDKDGILLGVVPADAILKILDKESVENLLKFGGITNPNSFDNILSISVIKSLKHRLPWLLLGLLGGIFVAGIISAFSEVLLENVILAAFIPLILYMASAVSTQTEIFIIRDLSVNPEISFREYFLKQLSVITLISIATSSLVFVGGILIYQEFLISLTIAIALLISITSAVLTGLGIPFLFKKLKFDPANASGPIVTIIQDALSIFIYFGIAHLIL